MFRKTALSLGFIALLGVLCACSPRNVLTLKKGESNQTTERAETTAATKIPPKTPQISAPIAIPPVYDKTPGTTAKAHVNPALPNGLPALKPAKGVNVETLFSERIKDNGKRFDRVENAVVDLRKEFDAYKPAIVRLAAVESDIQGLIKELEVLLQEPYPEDEIASSTPPRQATLTQADVRTREQEAELHVEQLEETPTPISLVKDEGDERGEELNEPEEAPTATKEKKVTKARKTSKPKQTNKPAPRPAPKSAGIIAQNIRVGEHHDKVRFVIDGNAKLKYTLDIDNEEKLIILELTNAKWSGKDYIDYPNSKLLEDVSIEPSGDAGSLIIITLKKNSQILRSGSLTPDNTSAFHRIYFDLAP